MRAGASTARRRVSHFPWGRWFCIIAPDDGRPVSHIRCATFYSPFSMRILAVSVSQESHL